MAMDFREMKDARQVPCVYVVALGENGSRKVTELATDKPRSHP